MAEDTGDKTEAPTPKRRQQAREKGQIARSPDLTSAALLVGMTLLLSWFGTGVVGALRDVLANALGEASFSSFKSLSMGPVILQNALAVLMALLPIFGGLLLLGIVANLAQVGLFFSFKKLQPNFAALSPIKGFSKLFGARGGGFQLLMNATKMILVALVAYSAVHGRLMQIVTIQQLDLVQIFGLSTELIYQIVIRIAILLFVLALIDYLYQRFKHEKDLKMTKQQVKDEMRSMDGDPMVKQRRRQIQQQLAMKRIKSDVPTADVIVTNPTHYSVALKYDADKMHAPKVVAKGADLLAFRIREIARENKVPILERPPLARALYNTVEVGQEIPEELYSAVAEILAYVFELSGRAKKNLIKAAG